MEEMERENTSSILFLTDISSILFSYLDLQDATQLRTTCKEACELVKMYPWNDVRTEIRNIKKWKIQ